MKITIDEKACTKNKMTPAEVLVALAVKQVRNFDELMENLFNREILVQHDNQTLITQYWSDVVDEILCDSSGSIDDESRLQSLAKRIQECFPKGKQPGSGSVYYFRCNVKEITSKLKKFFMKYGNYPDDAIVDATKRYVASFNGNYTGMRLAKYFIMKDAVKQGEDGSHVEGISDLATFLENTEENTLASADWMMNARN